MTVTNVLAVRIPPGVKEGFERVVNGMGIGVLLVVGLFLLFWIGVGVRVLWCRWQDRRDEQEKERRVEDARVLSAKVHEEGRQAFRDGKPCRCPYLDWERIAPWEGGWTQEMQRIGR